MHNKEGKGNGNNATSAKKRALTEPLSSEEKASLSYRQEFTDFQISFRKIAKLPEEATQREKKEEVNIRK